MRPRYLEIEGLQSFKELQKVDFDKLSETGLFGIFGPTGSGKSSILDAITLALYGSVYRAAKGTQGIINTDMNGIKVSFTFDLTKEGKRKTYRVERQYKRKKDSESSAEAKLVRLLEVSEGQEFILADKHSDVNNCITQLVGLKFEDFTRSVVLPQNKFQEFLLSPRGEKTKMLERIFYLEEYGRQLADKVSRQMGVTRNRLSNLEGALSTLGDASPEALIESERRMMEAQLHRSGCADRLKHREEEYAKGRELYKLSQEYDALLQKWNEYHCGEAEIKRLQEACQKSEAASQVKPIISAFREAEKGYRETALELNMLTEKLREMELKAAERQKKHETALQQRDVRLPELIKHKTILQECLVVQQEMEVLGRQLTAARAEYAEINSLMEAARKEAAEKSLQKEALGKEVAELEQKSEQMAVGNERRKLISRGLDVEKELRSLESSLKKQTEKFNETQANLNNYQTEHNKAYQIMEGSEKSLKELTEQKSKLEAVKPADKEAMAERQGQLVLLDSLFQGLITANEGLAASESKLMHYKNQAASLAVMLSEVEQQLQLKAAERDGLMEQLDLLQEQHKHFAAALLANSLKQGEQCPVCGSLEHPQPAAFENDESIVPLEQRQEELRAALESLQAQIRDLEHEAVKLKQQQSSLQELVELTEAELQKKKLDYHEQRQSLPEAVQGSEREEIMAYMEAQKTELEGAARIHGEWESSLQMLNEQIKRQETLLSEARINQGRLAALCENTKALLEKEEKQLEEQKSLYRETAERHMQMLLQVNTDSFQAETERIAERDEQTSLLSKTIKEKRSRLDELVTELQTVLEKINDINELLNAKKSEGLKLKEQREEKERKIKDFIGDKCLNEELEKAVREMDVIENSYKQTLEELNQAKGSLEETQRQKAGLQSSFDYFKEKLETEKDRLLRALAEKGFAEVSEAEANMLTPEKSLLYQNEINRYYREKGSLEDRLQNIKKLLEEKAMDEQQWQQLCEAYELAKAELEQSIAQLEAARNQYLLIKGSFEKWIKLKEEHKAVCRRKDMLEQIQKLLKGNAFIEFISEERMRYIAREASVTLGELTKFRYSVELDSENGFVIRDNANGGVLRSVASLSGGETFLTSLSLALALSSQLQLKGQSPLEFFFLDEGFGTLDNNLLDTVIDSLERLSSIKRVIGLISHVPEMKSRIARRLIVEAPDRAGKGSRVSIEKA